MRLQLDHRPAQVLRFLPLVHGQDLHQEGHQQGLVLSDGRRMGHDRHAQRDAEADQGGRLRLHTRLGGRRRQEEEGRQPLPRVRRGTLLRRRMQHLQSMRIHQVRLKDGRGDPSPRYRSVSNGLPGCTPSIRSVKGSPNICPIGYSSMNPVLSGNRKAAANRG